MRNAQLYPREVQTRIPNNPPYRLRHRPYNIEWNKNHLLRYKRWRKWDLLHLKHNKLNPLPPKRLIIHKAALENSECLNPLPALQRTSCIDMSLPPKRGGQPQSTNALSIFPSPNLILFDTSSKLFQKLLQLQEQQPLLPPCTYQRLSASVSSFLNYSLLQKTVAKASMPHSGNFFAPPTAERSQVRYTASETQSQAKCMVSFTPYQIGEMMECFNKKNYLNTHERKELARRFNLTETQVKIWFRNQRHITKKAGEKPFDNATSITQLGAKSAEKQASEEEDMEKLVELIERVIGSLHKAFVN